MAHVFEEVTGSAGALSFQFNGQFALKNYNVEIINGNRLKVVSTANEMFSLLEADISEVEINGITYSDPNAAQIALTSLVHSDAEPVVLTKEQYMALAAAAQGQDRGTIAPDTATPTGGWQVGWYKPTTSSASPGTNYPNQGNQKAISGFSNKLYYDGTTWLMVREKFDRSFLPQFANLSFPVTNTATEKVQCVDNFVPYQLLDGKTATSSDTPSTSPTIWISLNENYSNEIELVKPENYNGYITNSGVIQNGDTNYKYTKIQQLKKGDKINYSAFVTQGTPLISLWNADGSFKSNIPNPTGSNVYLNTGIYIASEDVGIRFCFRQKDTNGSAINTNSIFFYQNLKNKTVTADEITVAAEIISYADINGFILNTGVISNGDLNYKYTGLKAVTAGEKIDYSVYVTQGVPLITLWGANGSFLGFKANPTGSNVYLNTGIYIVESGVSYLRFCYRQKDASGNLITTNSILQYKSISKTIQGINTEIKGDSTPLSLFAPSYLFTVANDADLAKRGHNRNYCANIYLDHFFKDLMSEPDYSFGNGVVKKDFLAPVKVTDSNESNPTVQYNGGVSKLETDVSIKVFNGKSQSNILSIKNFSTLNSASKNSHPKVLCIGDSITYAELATYEEDNFTQNHGYPLITKELFMKDNVDAGSGYNVTFLGTYKKQKTFEYGGQKTATIFHEGIRGIKLADHYNGNVNQFWDGTKWSVLAFLNKYRTLDDNGVRLTLGNGTGSLINAGNLNNIDVCKPTHIVFMLGANDGSNFVLQQYKDLISTIKTELPNCYIGLALSDSGGTYFPSKYPMIDETMTFWNDTDATRLHRDQYNNFKAICDFYDNATMRNNKIFILPFFHCQVPYSYSYTKSDALNSSEIYPNQKMQKYGWGYHVHINAYGHMDWAYQLYGWLKYTSV